MKHLIKNQNFIHDTSYMHVVVGTVRLISFTGLQFREEEKLTFLRCQTCNITKCKYISCNEEIDNYVFCARQHVISFQTSSSRSSMETTSMETKTSQNQQTTTRKSHSTRKTAEQEKDSKKESADKTAQINCKSLLIYTNDVYVPLYTVLQWIGVILSMLRRSYISFLTIMIAF